MSTTKEGLNKIKRLAIAVVAAGALGLAAIVGSAAVANADPVTKVGSDPVAPANPGRNKAPFTKVGSDPVTSIVTGIADAVTSGATGVEIPDVPIKSPWPGGAWADHDWREGYPGGAFANKNDGKGGGGYLNGRAGGAWNHR
ncbi:hypothetical protein FR943_21475 [Mycobacterium sp. TNTM28]|uniref:Uncharacterized protein n=1 Tax=[Mycobacterium] fortunisiensis TaxID=2600579 RepID=A0ABS6KRX5_9MYCO|nr:hypothetical protein [[Mycobacterium] fortunisiensis]MBU9766402.1 hypothetical protein [[Mycobacterium] fortunisiensis]